MLKICVSGGLQAAVLVITSQIGCQPWLCVLPFAATCPLLYRGVDKRDGRPQLKKDAHDEGSPNLLVGMDAAADRHDVDQRRGGGNHRQILARLWLRRTGRALPASTR